MSALARIYYDRYCICQTLSILKSPDLTAQSGDCYKLAVMTKNPTRIVFAIAALGLASCTPPSQSPAPAPAVPNGPPTGRYQVATVSDGERGSTLVLLDTTTGETWFFHQPQGPLFNGFWGDVPRVTSPGESWKQAFQMLLQQPQQPGTATPPAATTAPAPTTPPAR